MYMCHFVGRQTEMSKYRSSKKRKDNKQRKIKSKNDNKAMKNRYEYIPAAPLSLCFGFSFLFPSFVDRDLLFFPLAGKALRPSFSPPVCPCACMYVCM